jgi:hypothetical protein
VLDYDEEYIVTFPNGYGRSILIVPWIELGGSVTIACAKLVIVLTVETGCQGGQGSPRAVAPSEEKKYEQYMFSQF